MARYFTLICISVIALCSNSVIAQTDTTFTYQGQLNEAGTAANGPFNLDFALFDALIGGTQIGSEVMFNNQPVVDGLFTVELDFGALAFNNTSRWIEISVNGTELSPRHPITRSPYSIQTRGIFVDDNNRVGIGTTSPLTALHVQGILRVEESAELSLIGETTVPSLHFRNPSTGDDWVLKHDANKFHIQTEMSAGTEIMALDFSGKVGIGTTTPEYALHVESNSTSARTMYGEATANSGSTIGVFGKSASPSGFAVFGQATASTGFAYGGRFESYSSVGVCVLGFADDTNGVNYGVVGDCRSPNGFDFYAAGPGTNYGSGSSRRWKNNIEPISDPLDKIAKLQGVYFNWDDEHGGNHDVGMIAEEVGRVLPEIVNYEENGIDAIGMDYSKMTPLLVEAVNALHDEKDDEINSLWAQNAALLARLERLERLEQIVIQQVSDRE